MGSRETSFTSSIPGYRKFEGAKSTYVGARLRQGRDEALANGVSNVRKYNWNRAGLFFERNHSWRCAGQEYIWRQTHQFQRIGPQSIRVRARPTIIQPNIYAIGPAKFLKGTSKNSCFSRPVRI